MKGTVRTLKTFRKVSNSHLYTIDYRADYKLDKLLAKGASNDQDFAKNVCKILLNGLPVSVKLEGACSTFVVETPDGNNLFARNFDYKSSTPFLVTATPKSGYKSIALANLGHLGLNTNNPPEKNIINKFKSLAAIYSPLDGMNEKGFAVAVNTAAEQITHQCTGRTPVMTTCAIRLLLDKASDVSEGIDILKNVDMNSSGKIGYHFQLADRSGDSAIVEYIDNKMVVIKRNTEFPYLCLTNFTLSTKEKNGIGQERFEIINNKLHENIGVMSEREAQDLLKAARLDGHKLYKPNDMYYDSSTQWSAIYNLSEGKVSVWVKDDYDRMYEFSL